MENVVNEFGYKTVRKTNNKEDSYVYSILYDNDEVIGRLNPNFGSPFIQFQKRNKHHVSKISKNKLVIEPIKDDNIHEILDWHKIDGKYHILGDGRIRIYFIPANITVENVNNYLKGKLFTQDMIDKLKIVQDLTPEILDEISKRKKELGIV